MAAAGGNIVWFTYTGAEGEQIPDDATHIIFAVRIIPAYLFAGPHHHNIVEVICLERVEKIGRDAFQGCPNLRQVIMPGVEIVEKDAFNCCAALEDVECGKLQIIGKRAFAACRSLRSINLPSIRVVEEHAFAECRALIEVKSGNKLERIEGGWAFMNCTSLERITIPLKDGLIADDTFEECERLKHVDLAEGELHETIAALHLEEWRNDMNIEIDSINQILPTTPAGEWADVGLWQPGEKARAIRRWIISVLGKIIHYQAEHQRILDGEVASALELALPRDTVLNNVLPFLELPSYTFEVEFEAMNEEDLFIYDDDDDDEIDENRHKCCCLRKLWPSSR